MASIRLYIVFKVCPFYRWNPMETCPEAYTLKNQGFFVVVMVLYSTTKASLVLWGG